MKKQPQITEQTKDKLRSAFWTLYSSKPIDKITIKEITDLAGYNRGTFYLYYKDVYDIFASIETELLQASEQILETARESRAVRVKKSYEHDYGAGKEIFRLCKCIAARPLQQPVQQKAAGNDLANTASVCNPASLYKTGGKHSGGILPLRSACRNIKLGQRGGAASH